jgi:xanthine dehydrogenase accessory factor
VFDLGALAAALASHRRVARVVIAGVEGSSPREVGASMLVFADGQSGTIGGGALEFEACSKARLMLAGSPLTPSLSPSGERGPVAPLLERISLGPSLGQCCGGAVVLWTEVFEAVPETVAGVVVRGGGEMPLAVARVLAAARGQGVRPAAGLVAGWLVEPVAEAERQVWVWGAGHVGRALVSVLAPLPKIAVTWVDVAAERFPEGVPEGVTVVPASDPAVLADHAPLGAEHLVLTYSHALDLELCHRLLRRGFRSCGLIGSATKWARFRSRLGDLGHSGAAISRIRCPIGDPSLGKHPQAIAVGVAAEFLRASQGTARELRA